MAPQKSWSKKDERQYEHIKSSQKKRGDRRRAEEIAARTVNKQRKQEGRTKAQKQSRRSSSKNGRSLEAKSRDELYQQAKKMKIDGRSKMNKGQLVKAIRGAS